MSTTVASKPVDNGASPRPQGPVKPGATAARNTMAKPPPTGPAPPAPVPPPTTVPPTPSRTPQQQVQNIQRGSTPTATPNNHHTTVNGALPQTQPGPHPATQKGGGKKKPDTPIDPATVYESLRNRIAALEEEEVQEEEEERRFAEEAQKSVKGMGENAIHTKYVQLFSDFRRIEREHAREKQKLVKDKDAAKGQLNKANQIKTKMENLARELQKDNKRLREDSKRLAQCVEDAQDEIAQMKADMLKRANRTRMQDLKYREQPDIVVKVVCRYRAELFFKISRKTKLARLFNAWTERVGSGGGMTSETVDSENASVGEATGLAGGGGRKGAGKKNGLVNANGTGNAKKDSNGSNPSIQFIFTHNGRNVDADVTPEEQGIEDGDEILAVELMDLTTGPGVDELEELGEPRWEQLKKNWTDDPREAQRTLEEIFDNVTRERLKDVLRQYELRERHFESVIRSKELEVLLCRARATEQKQLSESEKGRSDKLEEENIQLRKELEESQIEQSLLIDRLIMCCKEIMSQPNVERTQRLFASLRDDLEKRSAKLVDSGPSAVGGG